MVCVYKHVMQCIVHDGTVVVLTAWQDPSSRHERQHQDEQGGKTNQKEVLLLLMFSYTEVESRIYSHKKESGIHLQYKARTATPRWAGRKTNQNEVVRFIIVDNFWPNLRSVTGYIHIAEEFRIHLAKSASVDKSVYAPSSCAWSCNWVIQ